jgi:hypothetical protein
MSMISAGADSGFGGTEAARGRCRQLAVTKGMGEAEADKLAAAFSSRSLRAGFATTAAEHDAPGYRIQSHMRHRNMGTIGGYIRGGEQRSGLSMLADCRSLALR